MLKRTRKYVKLFGYELDTKTKKPQESERIIDTGSTDVDSVYARARREFPEFLVNSVEFHRQVVTMPDKEFYAHGEFGEDVTYNPAEDSAPVDPDADEE